MLEWCFKGFYEGVFYEGRAEVRIKELLRYRLSMTHGCAFCNKGNVEAARRAGVSDAQLDAIMNEESAAFFRGGARGPLRGGATSGGIAGPHRPRAPGLIRFFGSSVRLTDSMSPRWPGSMRSR